MELADHTVRLDDLKNSSCCDGCRVDSVLVRHSNAAELAQSDCNRCILFQSCIDRFMYAWHQSRGHKDATPEDVCLIDRWRRREDSCSVMIVSRAHPFGRPGNQFWEISIFSRPNAPEAFLHTVFDITVWTLETPPPRLTASIGYGEDILQSIHPQLRRLQTWLHECQRHHGPCSERRRVCPKRLVDLRAINTGTLYLIDGTDQDSLHPDYTTASYVWGQGNRNTLLTNSQNCAELMQGFSLERLPQVLRDIVLLTVAIGIRYVWIDAICIVQDDIADWTEQAAEMQNIYIGSYLTIVAAKASDCGQRLLTKFRGNTTQGLASDEPPHVGKASEAIHAVCNAGHGNHPPTEVHVQGGALSDCSANELSRRRNVMNALEERAWCFQEYLVASRIVYFGPCMLEWHCKRSNEDELGLLDDQSHRPYGTRFRAAFRAALMSPPSLMRECGALWRGLLSNYTGLRLSFESDRLTALAGIAGTFKGWMPQANYKAGLWSLEDLLWFVPANHNDATDVIGSTGFSNRITVFGSRIIPYQAPTWSWASVSLDHDHMQRYGLWGIQYPDGLDPTPTDFFPTDFSPSATVNAWQCISSNRNAFSNVVEGSLKISARHFTAILTSRVTPHDPNADAVFGLTVPENLVFMPREGPRVKPVTICIDCWPAKKPDPFSKDTAHKVTCLLLGDLDLTNGRDRAYFMICRQIEDVSSKVYERLGLVHFVTRNLELEWNWPPSERSSTGLFMDSLGYSASQFCIV